MVERLNLSLHVESANNFHDSDLARLLVAYWYRECLHCGSPEHVLLVRLSLLGAQYHVAREESILFLYG